MNYLEFKQFFMQIKSSKAIIFIESDWVIEEEIIVSADYGTAQDFASSYQISTSFSSILNTHSTNDFVIAYASSTTISAILEALTPSDMANAFVITTSIDGKLEAHPCSTMYPRSYSHVIDYYIGELIAYAVVDMLIQFTHTINDYAKLTYGEAKDLLLAFAHTISLGSVLGSHSSTDIEDLIYSFTQNYTILMDAVSTNDFKSLHQVIMNLSLALQQNGVNDLKQGSLNSTTSIIVAIEMLRDAYISDYASDYLSDLASSSLETLKYIQN